MIILVCNTNREISFHLEKYLEIALLNLNIPVHNIAQENIKYFLPDKIKWYKAV